MMANAFDQFDDQPNKPNPFDVNDDPRQNFFDMPESDRQVSRLVPNINHIMKGLSAFGEGFSEGIGPIESLGLSDDSKAWLAKNKVLPSKDLNTPFMAFNQAFMVPLAAGIEAVARSPVALYRGTQALAISRGIPPDIPSIPDAFMGSPHPMGIPRVPLSEPKPFVKPVDIKPIEGSTNPGVLRSEAAKTSDPLIDAILDHPILKTVIDNPVVDDTHTIPNSLGGSTPVDNPTLYRDRDFPKTMTVDGVTFDTSEPSAVHENVEEFVIDALVKGGMDQATALKVAFWNFGEVAEDAWYRSHGMDPEKVEAEYTDILNKIASRPISDSVAAGAIQETIKGAAVFYKGKTYTGASHYEALEKASKEVGKEPEQLIDEMTEEEADKSEGFITSTGRHVDRAEAAKIANAAKQTEKKSYSLIAEELTGVPPDLFKGTYPDGNPAKAGPGPIDKPTPEESARGRQMLEKYLAGEGNPSGIVAFHGSPSEFGKFNTKTVDVSADSDLAERYRQGRGEERGKGFLYQVSVKASPDDFLNLDKPLMAQSDKAKDALGRAGVTIDERSGADAWDALREAGSADEAAKTLQDAGLAGTSREHGVYSVFDPNAVQITHVNGQPILDAARDLGVIGPPKVPLTEGKPAEAAARATGGGGTGGAGPPARGGPGAGVEPPQPTGNPWRDRFEHFVGKLETPDDVKQLIREAADEKGEFPVARQGNIRLSQVEDIATAAGVEPGEINQSKLGRFLKNDNDVRTSMQLMLQVTENVKEAARNVRADGSPENLIKLQEAIMRRDLAVEQVVGLRAEWGRTGNVFQEFLRDVKDQEGLSSFLKDKGRTPKDLRDIADAVDALDRSQTARLMNDLRIPTAWDKFMWYYVNSLISGLVTHGKYVIANATFAGAESAVVTPVAGVVGTVRRSLLGGSEGVFIGEAAARMWGLVAGTPDAIVAAAKAARTGLQTPLPGEIAQNIAPKSKNVFQQAPIGGPIGTLVGLPSRGASAIHSFFNFLGYRASMEAQAYRAAVKELPPATLQPLPPVASDSVRFFHGGDNPTSGGGRWVNESEQYARNYRPGESVHYVDIPNTWLDQKFPDTDFYRPSGGVSRQSYPSFEAPEQFAKQMAPVDQQAPRLNDTFWQRRQNAVDNPTKEMMDNAIEEGYRLTYINELGPAAKAISRGIKATKLGQFIMPFTHIPFNILSRGVDYSPAAFLPAETRADLFGKNGAVKQDMAIARVVVGSAVGAWAVNMVANDRMTGAGPTDPKERAQWLATGHQPYSIRIGDEWYSFNRFGSLGTMLGLHSNLAEVIPHLKPDSEELTKALIMTVHSTGRLLEDEVGFQGLAGLIDAINDPTRNGARYISNLAGGLLPMSSFQRQTASSMDPYMRETKSVVDGLRYYIPVVRQDLLPKRDWLGEPITNAGYGGDLPIPGLSSIIQHRPAAAAPIAEEMKRLDLHPAVPVDRVGGVKLPPKLYDQYQMAAGQLTRQVLSNWVAQPSWYQMPEFARAEVFRRSISAARQQAGAMMMGMYPQIIQQGVQQQVDQINGVKPTKLKD